MTDEGSTNYGINDMLSVSLPQLKEARGPPR